MTVSYDNEEVRQECKALMDPHRDSSRERFNALRRLRNKGLLDDDFNLTKNGQMAADALANIVIELFESAGAKA